VFADRDFLFPESWIKNYSTKKSEYVIK